MSSRSWKPLNSVATTASARRWSSASAVSTAARLCPAIAAVPWPITTTRRMLPSRRRARTDVGQRVGAERDRQATVALDDLAPQRLAERRRRLGDLLEQEVREVAAVDVAGGDLGVLELVVAHGERRAVERVALDARRACRRAPRRARRPGPRGGGALGVGRRLAVHAQVGATSPRPGRRARWRRRRRPRPGRRRAPGRCPRSDSRSRSGAAAVCAAMPTEPSSSAHGRAERLGRRSAPPAMRRATSAGITLASVVISAGTCRPSSALRSA